MNIRVFGVILVAQLLFNSVVSADETIVESVSVQSGLDILQRDDFKALAGRRVGLITNHTGLNRSGQSVVQLLHDARDVELVALFSPEHGFKGALDQTNVEDARDQKTGLKIFSLYGKTRVPTPDSLNGIDTLVFDIQDIGTRFYTYVSTMGGAMRSAAEHGLQFVVLDRPNPIGGLEVQGPVLDQGSESFVGFHSISVRHGMTIGELARMFRDEMNLDLELSVVKMEGWKRSMMYDETGLLWVNPSPNMRSLTEAVLYPGIGLLETTNISVGRGTDTPFEVIGAPWIDPIQLAYQLNQAGLLGVRFVPVRLTPESSKYEGELCGGVNIVVTDRSKFDPLETGLTIATQLRRMYPDDWQTKSLNRLLASDRVASGIIAGESADALMESYQPDLEAFKKRRARYLLY